MPYRDPEKDKECKRQAYRDNKAAYVNRAQALRTRISNWIFAYKLKHPCVDCGEEDVRCLDFDHRDRATKLFNIGNHRVMSLVKVQAEIAKCDVRCANCHRKKTWDEDRLF